MNVIYRDSPEASAIQARVARLDAIKAQNPPRPCPCGGTQTYEPPHAAEPDCNVGAWRGGYSCGSCGYIDEEADRDE